MKRRNILGFPCGLSSSQRRRDMLYCGVAVAASMCLLLLLWHIVVLVMSNSLTDSRPFPDILKETFGISCPDSAILLESSRSQIDDYWYLHLRVSRSDANRMIAQIPIWAEKERVWSRGRIDLQFLRNGNRTGSGCWMLQAGSRGQPFRTVGVDVDSGDLFFEYIGRYMFSGPSSDKNHQ